MSMFSKLVRSSRSATTKTSSTKTSRTVVSRRAANRSRAARGPRSASFLRAVSQTSSKSPTPCAIRQVVIVNLQNADRTLLQRVVDFTSGVAYTIDGKIQKLAEAIYLVVPAACRSSTRPGLRDTMIGRRNARFHV